MKSFIRATGQATREMFQRPKAPHPLVTLTSWSPKGGGINFGDQLSKIIVSLMLSTRGMTLDDEAVRDGELGAIGSILHLLDEGATVWGSGANGKIAADAYRFKTLDVRAVRGPRTRQFLMARGIAVPEVYGDPALLIGLLSRGRFDTIEKSHRIGFVPNLNDMRDGAVFALPPGVKFISPMRAWHRCIRDILGCEMVVASSLHGLVIAEAFGIPARHVKLSEHEPMFKYLDYYEGTGRFIAKTATSIASAIELGGEPPPQFRPGPLLDAFPWDLWLR